MMKPAPAATFIMAKADFLLEIMVVTFDPPSAFGDRNKLLQRDICWKCGEPVFDWGFITLGPFHHEPLFGSRLTAFDVAMGGSDMNGGEASAQRCIAAFAPGHRLPGLLGQRLSQRLGGDRPVIDAVTHTRGGAAGDHQGV